METDRSISKSLSQTNNNQSLNNDNLTANIKTLTSILTDMNSSFELTAQKLKKFVESLEKASEELKNDTVGTDMMKTGLSAFFSKIWTELSTVFGKNIQTIKGFRFNSDTIDNQFGEKFQKGAQEIFKNDISTAKVLEWTGGLLSATSSLMKGNPIEAAMSVGKTMSSIISANRLAGKEIKQFYNELEQATLNYSIKVIAAAKDIQSSTDSIFDTDKANKLAQGMTGYNDAQQKMQELEAKLGSQDMQIRKKKKKVLGVTTGTKTIWGNVLDNYKKILGTDEDLIDKETKKLDMSIANSLKESGKLSTEATTTLNNMIAVQTAADAAMQQVNQILSDQAGKLGDNLQTALVKAFQTGETAASDFSKSVSDMLESIVVDQMFNSVFGEMLKELEEEMKESFSDSGDQDITDDIARFYKGYGNKVEQFNEGLEKMQEQIKNSSGLDILPDKKEKITQSSSKGYSISMSEDTGGAILGRVTGLHETGLRLEGGLNTMLGVQSEGNKIFAEQSNQLLQLCSVNVQSMYHLEDINKNTKHLAGIKQDLQDIKQNTSKL